MSGGKIGFLVGNGGYTESTCGSQSVNDGKWHYIAGVFDRSSLKFSCYVDGAISGTVALGSNYTNMNDAAPRIGTPVCCVPYTGNIDDIRIYSANLSDAMIYKLYADSRQRYVAER